MEASNHPINKLPNEIMTEIFKCLSPEDRRTARLVCSAWDNIYLQKSFVVKEKFVFKNFFATVQFLNDLSNNRRLFFNLEFRNLDFSPYINTLNHYDFWSTSGSKVLNLNFIRCVLSNEMMEAITVHCTNLTSWLMISTLNNNAPFSKTVFQNLFDKGIIRRELRFLEIFCDSSDYLTAKFLLNTFSIFPSIIRFTLCIPNSFLNNTQIRELEEDNLKTFLPKLEFRFIAGGKAMPKIDSLVEWKLFLNQIRITRLPTLHAEECNVLYFQLELGLFSYLKSLTFDFNANQDIDFIRKVLNDCPQLRFMELTIFGAPLNHEMLNQLLRSSLDTLILRTYVGISENAFANILPVNRSIRSLYIHDIVEKKEQFVTLLAFFSSLEHLTIKPLDDSSMFMLRPHKNLKSLFLTFSSIKSQPYDSCSASWTTSTFENLLILKLKVSGFISILPNNSTRKSLLLSTCFLMTESFLISLYAPNLRYLRVHVIRPEGILSKISSRFPMLQCLSISSVLTPSMEALISHLKDFKKLKYFRISNSHFTYRYEELEKFFHECPSLCFFEHRHSPNSVVSYRMDQITRKIVPYFSFIDGEFFLNRLIQECGYFSFEKRRFFMKY